MNTISKRESAPFLAELENIYADMDAVYDRVAQQYAFHCSGCEENCCLTRFYHHTWAEYFYLRQGFSSLPPDMRKSLKKKAAEVLKKTQKAEEKGLPPRIMCPLNAENLCTLYRFRPMICRLHGMAHELHPPGRNTVYGPGCEAFTKQTEGKNYIPFDRTPFYIRLAKLESDLKQAIEIKEKIKMTVAEMIIHFYERNQI
ncbi:MAG: YkgJ family cysteine cluster protein [Desulfococcaceae bacterium]|jgi:Fe-S-cluster containining protein|nr:YkgJ family cysteine cluster protein [Desulfococcaceae bacterium]